MQNCKGRRILNGLQQCEFLLGWKIRFRGNFERRRKGFWSLNFLSGVFGVNLEWALLKCQ